MYDTRTKVVRGDSKIPAPPVYVGLHEAVNFDETVKAAYEVFVSQMGEAQALDYILKELWGFDNTKTVDGSDTFYIIEDHTFRERTSNNVVQGKRIQGYERLDDEWILKGAPSEEARMISRQDSSYLAEIRNLSKRADVNAPKD